MRPKLTAAKNTLVTTPTGMCFIANFAPKNAVKDTIKGTVIIAIHPEDSIISDTTPSNKT